MRKPADDSIQGRIERAQDQGYDYSVPPGLEPLDEYGQTVWNLYIPAKSRWKDADLVNLHTLCWQLSHFEKMKADPDIRPADLVSWQKMVQGQQRLMGLNVPHNVAAQNARDGEASSNRGKRQPAGITLLK